MKTAVHMKSENQFFQNQTTVKLDRDKFSGDESHQIGRMRPAR